MGRGWRLETLFRLGVFDLDIDVPGGVDGEDQDKDNIPKGITRTTAPMELPPTRSAAHRKVESM